MDADPLTALPEPPETGDAGVDAALAPLARLVELPVAGHADVYEATHRALHDALADLDRG